MKRSNLRVIWRIGLSGLLFNKSWSMLDNLDD